MLAGDDNMKIEKKEMKFYGVTIIWSKIGSNGDSLQC